MSITSPEKSRFEFVEAQYEDSIAKMAEFAGDLGVTIGLEHIEIRLF